MYTDQAIALILAERTEQDKLWRTGRPSEAQYKFAAPHLLLLEEKLAQARAAWYRSSKEVLETELIKVAALALRALEEIE